MDTKERTIEYTILTETSDWFKLLRSRGPWENSCFTIPYSKNFGVRSGHFYKLCCLHSSNYSIKQECRVWILLCDGNRIHQIINVSRDCEINLTQAHENNTLTSLLPITVKLQKICNVNSTYLKEPLIYTAYSRSLLVFFRNTICCGRFLAF